MKSAHRPRHYSFLAIIAAAALLPALVSAQAIYRIVGPDGRVSFSDKPPAGNEKTTTLGPGGRSSDGGNSAELPFELREAMSRYPVTLYTGDNCEPCGGARNLLTRRGVPFAERTIVTSEDVEALKKMGIEAMVPTATIGRQRLKGFSESDWSEYLDAAGYPKTSRLPSGYRNPPASPLAPIAEATTPPARQAAPAPAATPAAPPVGPTPDNPAGIVF